MMTYFHPSNSSFAHWSRRVTLFRSHVDKYGATREQIENFYLNVVPAWYWQEVFAQ